MFANLRFARPQWIGLALTALAVSPALAADAPRVTLKGSGADASQVPVIAEVPSTIAPGVYTLKPVGDGKALPADVFQDGGKTYLGLIVDQLKGGESRAFTLQDVPKPTTTPAVDLKPKGSNVHVSLNGQPFTEYRTDLGDKPVLYPVNGPTGAPITRAYPMEQVEGETKDHPHQRSFWFTYGNINGFDFWASDPLNKPNPKFGTTKETSKALVKSGAVVGLLRTTDDWLGHDGERVCTDERILKFYQAGANRIIDVDVTLKATNGPVVFGDTKEGMFGLRVASSMDVKRKQGGKITNAEGVTDVAAWGKTSPWVDYTGPVEGKTVGIAILNHPDSFRYPTAWHVRDYGLFAANPFGWHDFGLGKSGEYTLPKGESITFHYRVIFHPGDTASSNIPAAFAAYATPPKVMVETD
ncbi:MAG: PmoA family protein [Isosphaeraceae bacterium]